MLRAMILAVVTATMCANGPALAQSASICADPAAFCGKSLPPSCLEKYSAGSAPIKPTETAASCSVALDAYVECIGLAAAQCGDGKKTLKPEPAPPSAKEALAIWNEIKASKDPAVLDAFAASYPDGPLAALAKSRAKKLRESAAQAKAPSKGVQVDKIAAPALERGPAAASDTAREATARVKEKALTSPAAVSAAEEAGPAVAVKKVDKTVGAASVTPTPVAVGPKTAAPVDPGAKEATSKPVKPSAPLANLGAGSPATAVATPSTRPEPAAEPEKTAPTERADKRVATPKPASERSTVNATGPSSEPPRPAIDPTKQREGAKVEGTAVADRAAKPKPGGVDPAVVAAAREKARIWAAQVELKRLGYPIGEVDGDWGPRSRAALRAFLRENGLAQSDRPTKAILTALRATPTPVRPAPPVRIRPRPRFEEPRHARPPRRAGPPPRRERAYPPRPRPDYEPEAHEPIERAAPKPVLLRVSVSARLEFGRDRKRRARCGARFSSPTKRLKLSRLHLGCGSGVTLTLVTSESGRLVRGYVQSRGSGAITLSGGGFRYVGLSATARARSDLRKAAIEISFK
ncbi:MAG: peptidoglycan-binding protein [Neomegalonema sp.]|nr:peptidoglycan-binding protein [Neomegalonema sp.]